MGERYKSSNGKNAFADFEPYRCGNPCPDIDHFKPLGTATERYQHSAANGFSQDATANGYKINGSVVKGMKQGTAPKSGSAQKIKDGQGDVTIWYDSSKKELHIGGTTYNEQ